MKKKWFKLVVVVIFIITAIIVLVKVIPTHQQKVANILAERNDSLVMTKYLTGDYPELKPVACERANEFNYCRVVERTNEIILSVKILIQEKTNEKILVEKLIDVIKYTYYYDMPENDERYTNWKMAIKKIEKELNPSLLKAVRDSSLNQNYDPILKSYYSSSKKVTQEILSNKFKKDDDLYRKIITYSILIDQTKQKELLELVSDDELAQFYISSLGENISYARKVKLATLAPFFNIGDYDLERNDYVENFFNRIKELNNKTILKFRDNFALDSEIEQELRKRKTEDLVYGFNDEQDNNKKVSWNYTFSYTKYSLIIISSVKTKEDFENALNFFLTVTSKGEEGKMLNILTASKSSLL